MTRKPRPTDEEFEELKCKRDEAIQAAVVALCDKHGWSLESAHVHVSGSRNCYCACPDGPRQHIWDGPAYQEEGMISTTCSRCGEVCAYHDMRVMPFD